MRVLSASETFMGSSFAGTNLSRGHARPERIGALGDGFSAEFRCPVGAGPELRTPGPEPARCEMKTMFISETDRAMHLMRDRGRDARRIVHADLCRRDFEGCVAAALYNLRAGMIRDDATGRRLRRQHRKLLLDRLELADGLTKLRAFVRVSHRLRREIAERARHLARADQRAIELH